MTTMSGQGACPNAGPVARLQAELEAVEGELVLARADKARGEAALAEALRIALALVHRVTLERDEARAEAAEANAELGRVIKVNDECPHLSCRWVNNMLVCNSCAEITEVSSVPETLVCW